MQVVELFTVHLVAYFVFSKQLTIRMENEMQTAAIHYSAPVSLRNIKTILPQFQHQN